MSISGLVDRFFIKKPRLREFVTRAASGSADTVVILFGIDISINRLKENGYLRASRLAKYASLFRDEAVVLQRLPLFCESDMTFVDVGANVGIFSSCMAAVAKVRRNFQVVAFEVHPGTFSRLQQNAKRSGFRAVNSAIGAKAETLTFVEGAVSHVTTSSEHSNSYNIPSRTFEVDVRTLDSFNLTGSIFLKIDVEGQELAVLQGASALFDEGRVHAVYLDGFEDRAVVGFLQDRGFDLRDCRTLEQASVDTFALLALKLPPIFHQQ